MTVISDFIDQLMRESQQLASENERLRFEIESLRRENNELRGALDRLVMATCEEWADE